MKFITFLSIIVLSATSIMSCGATPSQNHIVYSQKNKPVDLNKHIKNYLMTNPEVVIEIMENAQAYGAIVAKAQIKKNLLAHKDKLINDPRDYVMGNPNAKITIVEFFDYGCGYCKRVFPTLKRISKKNKDVRVILKEYPILGKLSWQAAQAALIAKEHGKYLEFHETILTSRKRLSQSLINKTLKKLGINPSELQNKSNDKEFTKYLNEVNALGQLVGVSGTPALIIGDTLYPGALPYKQINEIVSKVRRKQ